MSKQERDEMFDGFRRKEIADLVGDLEANHMALQRKVSCYSRAVDEIRQAHKFLASFLNPEERGLAVPAHVRDDVREFFGRTRVET